MIVNEQAAQAELLRRLTSIDYQDKPAMAIIDEFREEIKQRRVEYDRQAREQSANSIYRIARVEQGQRWIESIGKTVPTEYVAEVVEVRQADLQTFARSNGVNLDELMEALYHKRKEAHGAGGRRFQAYPLLFTPQPDRDEEEKELQREARRDFEANERRNERRKQASDTTTIFTAFRPKETSNA